MTDEHHRPPKYVDGVYKPHFTDPDADYAIYVWPLDPEYEPQLATVDSDGDAAGVIRNLDGKPLTTGGTTYVGTVYGEEIRLGELWSDRIGIDTDTIREKIENHD